jgi:hypothetical protein
VTLARTSTAPIALDEATAKIVGAITRVNALIA